MFLDEFEPLYEVYSNELAQVYVAKRYNNGREVTVKVSYYCLTLSNTKPFLTLNPFSNEFLPFS